MSETRNKKQNEDEKTEETSTIIDLYDKYNPLSLLIALIAIVTIFIIGANECRTCFNQQKAQKPVNDHKIYWVYGKNTQSNHLENVFNVLDAMGYKRVINPKKWDLLWAHDYPFRHLYDQLRHLEPHQKINHFPGCGYITNKVDLAITPLKYIPPAFKLPEDKVKLQKFAELHPDLVFVQKNNDHRNIHIKRLDEINLEQTGTFVQQYVDKPLLVDGHKFDIGIYTVITSLDPLRLYIYNGDALLRFCPIKYYPFDPENLDKYVVGDDYLPIWEVPGLDYYYNVLGAGMRESLNAYLVSHGKNPQKMWDQIEDSIRLLVLDKEPKMLDVMNRFGAKRNFFELMRFDFVADENLNVYLLEANMSPNLSSAHFPPNRLMYLQVLYNLMGLIGVGERFRKNTLAITSKSEEDMQIADKQLATFAKKCGSISCRSGCSSPECQLCKPCLSPDTRRYLVDAYKEHVNKGDFKRIFPPPMDKNTAKNVTILENYSAENQLQYRWFQGKCLIDSSWC